MHNKKGLVWSTHVSFPLSANQCFNGSCDSEKHSRLYKKNLTSTMASQLDPLRTRTGTWNYKAATLWSETPSCWIYDQCISVLNHVASYQHFQWAIWEYHLSWEMLPLHISRAPLVETLSSTFSQLYLLEEILFLLLLILLQHLMPCRLLAT